MSRQFQIKDINKTKETTTLIKSEKELVNHETGEVISREDTKITKEKNREKFIKIFIDNLDYIIEALKPIEKSIFFVLMHEMNYYNVINLSSTIRKTAQVALGLSQPAVSKGITALIEKKVLLKIEKEEAKKFNIAFYTGKEYLVNPQLIGSGSFKELSKIRRVITTTFDFDTFNATKEIDTSCVYSDYNEVEKNLDKHEIKQINQINSFDGKIKKTEIFIGEKDKTNSDDIIDIDVEQKANLIINTASEVKPIGYKISQEPSLFDEKNDDNDRKDNVREDWLMFEEERIRKEIIEQEQKKFEKLDLNKLKFELATKEYEIKKFKIENKNLDKELFELKEAELQMQKSEIEYRISLEMKKA